MSTLNQILGASVVTANVTASITSKIASRFVMQAVTTLTMLAILRKSRLRVQLDYIGMSFLKVL